MKTEVNLKKSAEKEIIDLPKHIRESLQAWVQNVIEKGLHETSKTGGYHMEKLSGDRKGQYSVRLNKSYRAIYEVDKNGEVHIVTIVEVNNHKY